MTKIYIFLFLILCSCVSFANETKIKHQTFITAKDVHYNANDEVITANGDLMIQLAEYVIYAQKMIYHFTDDNLIIEGKLHIVDKNGQIIEGDQAMVNKRCKQGIITSFLAKLKNDTILQASLAKIIDTNQLLLKNSVFTPCIFYCSKQPIWKITSDKTTIDYNQEKIIYRNVFFKVFGFPVLYLPYFSHPTPSANSQSGILIPSIVKDSLILPLYFKLHSNSDLTITPRLSKRYTIINGEFRHKVSNGSYNINFSYRNPLLKKQGLHRIPLDNKYNRKYKIHAQGNFYSNNIKYGFDIHRTSDKDFLSNYQEIHDFYLVSKLYSSYVSGRNYFLLEGYYFQDLRDHTLQLQQPVILPNINAKYSIPVFNNTNILFNIRHNTQIYSWPQELQFIQNSLNFFITSYLVSSGGHFITFCASNYIDLYITDLNPLHAHKVKRKTWHEHIQDVSTKWQYPLIKPIMNKRYQLKVEPIFMFVIGNKYYQHFSTVDTNAAGNNELLENNIFSNGRFSGNRLSFGISSILAGNSLYLDTFFGQVMYKDSVFMIGSIKADTSNNTYIFYRFRLNQTLQSITHEAGGKLVTKHFLGNLSFISSSSEPSHFIKHHITHLQRNTPQINIDAEYNLTSDLRIGGSSKINITSQRLPIVLTRSIRVTYIFDCVSISGAITDEFLKHNSRKVKKNRTKSFSIGLKVLNM